MEMRREDDNITFLLLLQFDIAFFPLGWVDFFKNGKGVMIGRLNILLQVSEEERHLRALETSGKFQIKAKQIGRNWSVTQMRVYKILSLHYFPLSLQEICQKLQQQPILMMT